MRLGEEQHLYLSDIESGLKWFVLVSTAVDGREQGEGGINLIFTEGNLRHRMLLS